MLHPLGEILQRVNLLEPNRVCAIHFLKPRGESRRSTEASNEHNKNTVFVKCDATLNRPEQHPPAAAECASFEQL
jgi:hypothetical protein